MALKMLVVVAPIPIQEHTVLVEPKALTTTQALAQEYVILYKKFVEFDVKELTKRMETIRKELQTVANDAAEAHETVVFECETGQIEFTPRAKVVTVPSPLKLIFAVEEKFGPDVAESITKIGITELRKVLSELEMKPYIEEVPGARTLKEVRLK